MARILVIDDEKNIRKMVRLALTQAGHEVETAEDGVQGLQLFGDGTGWDLTLVDQRMPGMEGREVVREARRRDPAARLVMITAFATSELATEVLQSGARDFLRKPFSTDVLRGAVTATLALPREAIPQEPPAEPVKEDEATETTEATETVGATGSGTSRSRAYLGGISYRVNGFSFWPLDLPESTREAQARMQSLTIGHVYQVRRPTGELGQCFVGITPHVRDQVQQEGGPLAEDDPFWEEMCGQALLNFVWEKAEAPPEVLPVYDVPNRWRKNRRSPAPWGPYARG